MAQRIKCTDVEQALRAAGHWPSEFLTDGWDPGWRCAPAGSRIVHVFHDGPGEADGLELYTAVLRAVGLHVVADAPHGGRHRLIITRP